jgi:hypothetical protein
VLLDLVGIIQKNIFKNKNMALLNENQQSRINNINWTVSSVSLLGSVSGLI